MNLAKLRQAKQTLTEKLKTLADYDTQILELTSKDYLENEIEQVDLTREIRLCNIDINGAIDLTTRGTITLTLIEPVVHQGRSWRGSCPSRPQGSIQARGIINSIHSSHKINYVL
jgi:hypothetical protein